MLFTLLFVCALMTSCKKVKFDESKKTLVVGLECDYAPFNWLETSKTDTNWPVDNVKGAYAEGYDVQIAKLLCEELGYTLVIKKIDWKGLIPALDAGTIDVIIAGMSPTEDRKQSINFTNAYYNTKHVVLTKADSKYANAKTFADLNGAKVVGQINTTYDTLAKQIASKETNKACQYLTPLDSVPLIVNAILNNAADLTVLEMPVAEGVVASYPSLTFFALEESFDLDPADTMVSIGIRKVDTSLMNALNDALAKISQETRDILMQTAVNASNNE